MNSKLRQMTLCLMVAGMFAIPLAGCGDDNGSSDYSGQSGTASSGTSPSTTGSTSGASSTRYGTGPATGTGGMSTAGAASTGTSTLSLAADPSGAIAYDKTSLATKAGKTTIDFTNASQTPHAVEVEGNGVEEETKTVIGGKASLTLDLKPGTYEFYCPIDSHKEQGMKGTLTVK